MVAIRYFVYAWDFFWMDRHFKKYNENTNFHLTPTWRDGDDNDFIRDIRTLFEFNKSEFEFDELFKVKTLGELADLIIQKAKEKKKNNS